MGPLIHLNLLCIMWSFMHYIQREQIGNGPVGLWMSVLSNDQSVYLPQTSCTWILPLVCFLMSHRGSILGDHHWIMSLHVFLSLTSWKSVRNEGENLRLNLKHAVLNTWYPYDPTGSCLASYTKLSAASIDLFLLSWVAISIYYFDWLCFTYSLLCGKCFSICSTISKSVSKDK